jgi:acyl-CoA synthetase (AMP-forming)/AMP-acid ligase II
MEHKKYSDNKSGVNEKSCSPKNMSEANFRASAIELVDFFKLGDKAHFYVSLPPENVASKVISEAALMLDADVLREEFTHQPLAAYDGSLPMDLAVFAPSQLIYLINHPELLALIHSFIITGRINGRMERWLSDFGVDAYVAYSTGHGIMALSPVSHELKPFNALGDNVFGVDVRGCLLIDSRHYSPKHLVTDDMVTLVSPSQFFWHGEFNNVIHIDGKNVFPEEVEMKIAKFFPHIRYYVTSRTSKASGEEVVLAIEYSSLPAGFRKEGLIREGLIEEMQKVLLPYELPHSYVAVNKFEESAGGVIRRTKYFS